MISCELGLNLDYLRKRIWEGLGLNRVYTKRRGETPDLTQPLIVKKDASVEQVVCIICLVVLDAFELIWLRLPSAMPSTEYASRPGDP